MRSSVGCWLGMAAALAAVAALESETAACGSGRVYRVYSGAGAT
jgi:hypothetical protein